MKRRTPLSVLNALAVLADIAVGAGKPGDGGLAQRQGADEPARRHGEDERDHGSERSRDQERRVVQFRKRVFDVMPNRSAGSDTWRRKKFIQARPDFCQRLGFTTGEADEDQAEIRHGEIENIDDSREVIVEACWRRTGVPQGLIRQPGH